MRSWSSALAFTLAAASVTAISIPTQQKPTRRRTSVSLSQPPSVLASSGDGSQISVQTVHDLIYLANVTIGGTVYPIQLDTGSSDLWIQGASSPLPNTQSTTISKNLTYGSGWASGNIAYAETVFAGITVKSQALLDVTTANNPALSYGVNGILGLGFTSLSNIDLAVNETGASTGRSLLYNLFLDNPTEPNFIAFSLQRSNDTEAQIQGTFSIGEYDTDYAAVMDSTAIPTWPVNSPSRWNVLLDSYIVGTNTYTVSSNVSHVPSGKAAILLDTGTTFSYVPTEVAQAIYGGVQGATYNPADGYWTVPCGAEVDMALQIGGQVFPVHPLDVTPVNPGDYSSCIGSFIPQSIAIGAGQFDWLVGVNFLRSVYSVFDFGDFDSSNNMGNPYIKLLALVEPNAASKNFHDIRGGTPLTNITYNASNSTSTAAGTVSLSDQALTTLNSIATYLPIILGVMGLNALILIILLIVGAVYMCKRRKAASPTSTGRKRKGRMTPLPLSPMRRSSSGFPEDPMDEPFTPPNHTYQPVSMALTDTDTLYNPTTPKFGKFDSTDKRRASSIAGRTSDVSSVYQPMQKDIAEESLLPPQTLRYKGGSMNKQRAMSYAEGASEQSSSRQRPSVQITDRPLYPPPAQFGGNLQSQHDHRRINSYAGGPDASSQAAPVAGEEDRLFAPPSPSFHRAGSTSDRPRSMA